MDYIPVPDEVLHKDHIDIWLELARTGSKVKYSAIRSEIINEIEPYIYDNSSMIRKHACFACQAAMDRSDGDQTIRCYNCPIDWGCAPGLKFGCPCEHENSDYIRWMCSSDVLERKMWAMRIAFKIWRR